MVIKVKTAVENKSYSKYSTKEKVEALIDTFVELNKEHGVEDIPDSLLSIVLAKQGKKHTYFEEK